MMSNSNSSAGHSSNTVVSRRFSLDNLPRLVKFVRQVEVYEAGNVVKLFYGGSAMYKYPGAIFGLSVRRVVDALNSGAAVEYNGA
jgi:hypothetical protein